MRLLCQFILPHVKLHFCVHLYFKTYLNKIVLQCQIESIIAYFWGYVDDQQLIVSWLGNNCLTRLFLELNL